MESIKKIPTLSRPFCRSQPSRIRLQTTFFISNRVPTGEVPAWREEKKENVSAELGWSGRGCIISPNSDHDSCYAIGGLLLIQILFSIGITALWNQEGRKIATNKKKIRLLGSGWRQMNADFLFNYPAKGGGVISLALKSLVKFFLENHEWWEENTQRQLWWCWP